MKDTDMNAGSLGHETYTVRTVLVVEDDGGLCGLIQKSLRREGLSTDSASNGAEAIAQIAENPNVLMLMDYRLPDMPGNKIIEILAERECEVPFIVMTGHGDERLAVEMMKLGARDYLVKDTEFLDLIPSVVRRVMHQLMIEDRLAMTESALLESEKRLSLALDGSRITVFNQDVELQYTWVYNPAFGLSVDQILGKTDMELVSVQDAVALMDMKCRVLETGVAEHDVFRFTVDGKLSHYDITVEPVYDDGGLIMGIAGAATDITALMQGEAALRRVEKLESIGVLAGGIAHDLNNLLTAILGNVSLAKMYKDTQKKDKRLAEAEKACMLIKDLTQQLLTFSKGGAPILRTAAIGELLRDITAFTLRGSNVGCEFSIPDALWPVEIDEGQINQVINNIVINANQAMASGGMINICAENVTEVVEDALVLECGEYVKISIADHGTGISKDDLPKIFDPFYTTKQAGSGLGLATSYSIIQKHNGYMAVESQLGVGTVFHIYLPASPAAILMASAEEKNPIMGSGRILVMDDEKHVRDTAATMLSSIGYAVITAIDGAEAIEIYKEAMESENPFDAAIIDLTIPGGMGGEEAIQGLVAIDPEVKAMVSSGYSSDTILANFREHGFMGIIPKPYNIQELSEILHGVIAGADWE